MDETWIYHHDSELKQEHLQWTEAALSASKQVKSQQSAKQIMASVSWDAKETLWIDYLQKGKIVNSEYYCSLSDQLDEKNREKRLAAQKIILPEGSAPAHKGISTTVKVNELKYELLQHPPYSPDLASSVYYLLRNLKQFLCRKRFLRGYSRKQVFCRGSLEYVY